MSDGPERKRSAAERFEEEDELRPEPDDPRRRPPEVPRPGNKYAWAVGVLGVMLVGVLLFTTTLPNKGKGLRGPEVGTVLPAFAAPLSTAPVDPKLPANVFASTKAAESAGSKTRACDVRSKIVLNSCVLREKPLVLTSVVTKGADCEPQVDRVERVRRSFPSIQFAAILSGDQVDDARRIVKNRGWTLPVGVDVDGRLQNLLGLGVCPTTIFSDARGRVVSVKLGNLTERELRAETRRLLPRG